MSPPPGDRIRRGNGMALRIAVVGGAAVALFAVLFFRLWSLQVIDGDDYLAEAQNNRTREEKVIAPRGDILDRNGTVLVDNRTSLALVVDTTKLPEDEAKANAHLKKLGALVNMPLKKVKRTIKEDEEVAAGAPVTLRRDVGYDVVYYLQENQREFPEAEVRRVFVRDYPHETRAAHVLGTVGEINEDELKEKRYAGLEAGDEIGKTGIEDSYDRLLRGEPGVTRVQVNAMGQPTAGGQLVSQPPSPGDNLKLTLDSKVQEAGEAALASFGLPGAFVSMDVNNGELLGLGSYPTYDPATFTKPLTQRQVDELYADPEWAPLTNRATEGHYPVGSTFKMITALAALEGGVITPSSTIVDNGSVMISDQRFQNAGEQAYGPVDLERALKVSSDVYFYLLGAQMNQTDLLQNWSARMGIAQETGIDLPEEASGLIPSKEWRDQLFEEGETDRPWAIGDNVQLAIGQGDLQMDPLQLAVAYAALANSGKIVTPHLAKELQDAAGRVLREFEFPIRREFEIDPAQRSAILGGLHASAQEPEGTSYPVFGGFPIPVAGKTGTAQRPPHSDQAWYVVLAPYPNPRIVTVVTVEDAGFGAESAAPAALQILEAYFDKQATAVGGETVAE
ncbi:MAG: penicillin-binding protein 2 [Solirubrobacterales bacterium]|nr:penicillin-binding protein 2 [Solirubrobacterales bacterium]